MTKYKTKDGSDRVVPGIGVTVDGVIETDQKIESPIFEQVEQTATQPATAVVVAPQAIVVPTEIKEQN